MFRRMNEGSSKTSTRKYDMSYIYIYIYIYTFGNRVAFLRCNFCNVIKYLKPLKKTIFTLANNPWWWPMKCSKALRLISVNSSSNSNLKPKHLLGILIELHRQNVSLSFIYIYIYIYIVGIIYWKWHPKMAFSFLFTFSCWWTRCHNWGWSQSRDCSKSLVPMCR